MAYYLSKPELVEAVQWTGDNIQEIFELCQRNSDLLLKVLQEAGIDDFIIFSHDEEPGMSEIYALPEKIFFKKFQPDSCSLNGSGCE